MVSVLHAPLGRAAGQRHVRAEESVHGKLSPLSAQVLIGPRCNSPYRPIPAKAIHHLLRVAAVKPPIARHIPTSLDNPCGGPPRECARNLRHRLLMQRSECVPGASTTDTTAMR